MSDSLNDLLEAAALLCYAANSYPDLRGKTDAVVRAANAVRGDIVRELAVPTDQTGKGLRGRPRRCDQTATRPKWCARLIRRFSAGMIDLSDFAQRRAG